MEEAALEAEMVVAEDLAGSVEAVLVAVALPEAGNGLGKPTAVAVGHLRSS